MTPEDVGQGVVVLIIVAAIAALLTSDAPPKTMPTVHVACTADGVILWEGDAARADYENGQWTVCATSASCSSTATRVRTSAACVVTPLVEADP